MSDVLAIRKGHRGAHERVIILAAEALAWIIDGSTDPISVETARQALEDMNAVLGERVE